MALQPKTLSFTLFLGAIAALPPLSIDMGLPAFPQVESQFGATASDVTLTLSIFLLGFATGPLLLGPLSDRFGRRPVLLAGLLLFALAGVACALSTSMNMLLVFRLLQGIGAGVGGTLPFAIVRDLFEGVQARMRMSAVTMVLGVGPIIAPLIGAGLLVLGDWRLIYGVLGIGGFVVLIITAIGFKESFPDGKHHSISPRGMMTSYGQVLRNRIFLGNAIVNAAGFACMFSYISGSSSVVMGNLGASSGMYSILFACSAAGFMLGSGLNAVLARRSVNSRVIVLVGNACLLAGSFGILGLVMSSTIEPIAFTALAALSIFGSGLLSPNVVHDALLPMGRQAGVASAALRCMQMLAGAAASALVAMFYDGQTAFALGGVMATFAVLAFVAQLALLKTTRSGAMTSSL